MRPKTRGDCSVEGVCPFVGCRHHLILDATDQGALHAPNQAALSLRQKDFTPWADRVVRELESAAHTCSLDVADEGSHTLAEVGRLIGVTRERVRQIEDLAMSKLKGSGELVRARRAVANIREGGPVAPTRGIVRLEDETLDLMEGRLGKGKNGKA